MCRQQRVPILGTWLMPNGWRRPVLPIGRVIVGAGAGGRRDRRRLARPWQHLLPVVLHTGTPPLSGLFCSLGRLSKSYRDRAKLYSTDHCCSPMTASEHSRCRRWPAGRRRRRGEQLRGVLDGHPERDGVGRRLAGVLQGGPRAVLGAADALGRRRVRRHASEPGFTRGRRPRRHPGQLRGAPRAVAHKAPIGC